ncbi:hypothetical protein [Cronobacter dublinensis]|uniref:hypothetical protein n=1 Tax=Cronobacter dublinensis TaxID=413497 RepID=UPI000CFAF513|nr:hypothetical protein [Cronobacter dublinensis]
MVIKDIVTGTVSLNPPAELIRRPGELNTRRHLSRAPHLCGAACHICDPQKKDVLHDALGLWGINAEDGLRYERRLRNEW